MATDIVISVDDELTALLQGSLSRATRRRLEAYLKRKYKAEGNVQVVPVNDYVEVPKYTPPDRSAAVGPKAYDLDISVVDEDTDFFGQQQYDRYDEYRRAKPDSLFAVLVPSPSTDGSLSVPSNLYSDPNSWVIPVTRPGEGAASTSWYDEMTQVGILPRKVTRLSMFVDSSGSMDITTVSLDYTKFRSDMTVFHDITDDRVLFEANPSEDWISYHIGNL